MPEYELPDTVPKTKTLLTDVDKMIKDLNGVITVLEHKVKQYDAKLKVVIKNDTSDMHASLIQQVNSLMNTLKSNDYKSSLKICNDITVALNAIQRPRSAQQSAPSEYAKHNDYMTKVQEAKKRLRKLFELRTELDEHQERLSAKMIAIDKTSAIGSLFGEISDYDE